MTASPQYEMSITRVAMPVDLLPGLDIRHVVIEDISPHPSAANGIHHVVRRIAREQIAAGDEARIVFLRQPSQEGELETLDVPTLILPLDGTRIGSHVVDLEPQIVDALTRGAGRDTVFHIHTARQPLLLSLARQLHRRGLAFGLTVHGRYSHVLDAGGQVMNWRSALYLRLVESHVLAQARFVQAVSPAEAAIIARLAGRARICVIPNAAYSSTLDGVPPAPEGRKPSASFPTFGYCGRYEIAHKGLDLLVEGFAAYLRAGGSGRLVLIGTGPARDTLAAMVRTLGIANDVAIHGPCFGEEKRRRMAEWDFFVQPSRFDGVPIAALEAGLSGFPLIVSTETGLAGHVETSRAGIVIPHLSAGGLATAFRQAAALAPGSWEEMAVNAHGMALEIGDWTLIARSLRSRYLPQ